MESMPMPEDPVLRQAAKQLEALGFAGELVDAGWVLRYVTRELCEIVGEHDPEALGIGRSLAARGILPRWMRTITRESAMDYGRQMAQLMAADLGVEELRETVLREGSQFALDALEEAPEGGELPVLWTGSHAFPREKEPGSVIGRIGVRLHDRGGAHRGAVVLYAPALPGSVVEMLTRGEAEMLARIASLDEPARHAGSILFCDLESSTLLSRRLPSAAYFELIRDFAAAADAAVVRHRGVVGKHAGDGVTAFFLTRDCGSDSAAARAALEAAREIAAATAGLGGDEEVRVNQGLHWSSGLVVGRLVTAGRLEVTALGDAVNEAARIEQSARGGQALASKTLIEVLDPGDTAATGLGAGAVSYQVLGELPTASEKARRDAGSVPVAEVHS